MQDTACVDIGLQLAQNAGALRLIQAGGIWTSKVNSTCEAVRLTCCPPGPPLRLNWKCSSVDGIVTVSVIWMSVSGGTIALLHNPFDDTLNVVISWKKRHAIIGSDGTTGVLML